MKIYLTRHGQTTGDVEGRFGGDYDDHLTLDGQQQAANLGAVLKDKCLEIILHSPRIRAVETAEIVSRLTGVRTEEIYDLRERNNYGVLTGLTRDEGRLRFPGEYAKIERDKTYHEVGGSEPYPVLWARVKVAFEQICRRPNAVLAVVTHGGVIRSIAREIFGYPEIKVGDCGIIEISFDGKSHRIIGLANVSLQ